MSRRQLKRKVKTTYTKEHLSLKGNFFHLLRCTWDVRSQQFLQFSQVSGWGFIGSFSDWKYPPQPQQIKKIESIQPHWDISTQACRTLRQQVLFEKVEKNSLKALHGSKLYQDWTFLTLVNYSEYFKPVPRTLKA